MESSKHKFVQVSIIGDVSSISKNQKAASAMSKDIEDAIMAIKERYPEESANMEVKVAMIASYAINQNASKLIRFANTLDKIEKNPGLTLSLFEKNPHLSKELAEDKGKISDSIKTIEKILQRRNKLISELFAKSKKR